MKNLSSNRPSILPLSKLLARVILLVITLLAVLAYISLATSEVEWVGVFPPGAYHLKIQNQASERIQGAMLNVFRGGTRIPAFGYPIDNYLAERNLISDEHGLIIALLKPPGIDLGGSTWRLFWIIPVRVGGLDYDCEITASGYRLLKFSIRELIKAVRNGRGNAPTTAISVEGRDVEIEIYEQTFILTK